MASKVNYFKIGLFIIGSVAVIVIFVIALGLGSWGAKKVRFETYIDESVQGLSIGSPVKHRGVQVGSVEDITFTTIEYDLKERYVEYSRYVMVVIAVDYNKFGRSSYAREHDMLNKLIDKGLRMRLTTQALTGISYIEVDYFTPEEHPPLEFPWTPKNKYIPSAKSMLNTFTQSIDQTLKKLENVDFVDIADNLNKLIVSLNTTLNEIDLVKFNEETLSLITDLKSTNDDIKDVISKASTAIDQADIKGVSQKLTSLLTDLDEATINANEAITGFKDTNQLVQEMLKPQSDDRVTIPELAISLDELLSEINGIVNENRNKVDRIIYKLDVVSSNFMEFSQDIKQDPGIIIFSEPPAPSEVLE
jgi:ABC-type transporter Mla subunit MlaD